MRGRFDLVELPHAAPNEVPSGQTLRALCTPLPLFPEKLGLDGSRNLVGDLILEREDVADIAVISFGPY